ncbi:MAG: primosomal protein N' [candidate division FCPU426 bacterium]
MFANVALPVPGLEPLTYRFPAETPLAPGMRVLVPLGRRAVIGFVTSLSEKLPAPLRETKAILRVLDPEPALTADLLRLGRWIADYYRCAWGEALTAMVPAFTPAPAEEWCARLEETGAKLPNRGLALTIWQRLEAGPLPRRELLANLPASASQALSNLRRRGLIASERREAGFKADPIAVSSQGTARENLTLTADQARTEETLSLAIAAGGHAAFLLHGVTGSGKTEVYLRAIAKVLQAGKGAIVLVPEIAQTPQTKDRILARFGGLAAVLHSALPPKLRAQEWRRIRHGQARVVLGPRSAVFAPVKNLGLIVVDEEHEPAYKQEDVPRYHARDVAAVRCQAEKALLLLGSATPSVESFANAQRGRTRLLTLPTRVDGKTLPEVRLVDMTREVDPVARVPLFSQALLTAVAERLANREQCILFLNRRGFATIVRCPQCGHILTCPDCSVSLVYHRWDDRLHCHSCSRMYPARPACPRCGSACVRLGGSGTQRVEDEIQRLFPAARLLRLDQDAIQRRGSLEETLRQFGQGEADILVGTQMVAKGIDFPNVTLVGIIAADTALHLPDFRAEERTFQLLVQVAGRAGRGGRPGLVLAQTYNPEHVVLDLARTHDYQAFFNRELEHRRDLEYPPFSRLAAIICRHRQPEPAWKTAQTAAQRLERALSAGDALLGPAPAVHERIAGESRFQILLKSRTHTGRAKVLGALSGLKPPGGVRLTVDVDPLNML